MGGPVRLGLVVEDLGRQATELKSMQRQKGSQQRTRAAGQLPWVMFPPETSSSWAFSPFTLPVGLPDSQGPKQVERPGSHYQHPQKQAGGSTELPGSLLPQETDSPSPGQSDFFSSSLGVQDG